jgi:hypothetical protein
MNAQPALKDLCLDLLVESAGKLLDLQWSDGRFATAPERETDEWNFFDQQFILPAALLYTERRAENPWAGCARLRQAILSNGRHLAGRLSEAGTMEWRLNGVVLGSPFVCQRLTGAWLQAYQMLKGQLPEGDAEAWREAIVRACEWLYQHKVLPFSGAERFTSHQVQTGTNHFSLYLSLLWLAGGEFGRPEWRRLAADLMRRLIADQRPGRYWEEHHGPALAYNHLTYHGVDQYTFHSGDDSGLPALRRGLDLHQQWTYPDGIPIECIDGRNSHLGSLWPWGLAGFTRWPDGRGYARLLLEALRSRQLTGEQLARVADTYLLSHDGEETAPLQKRPRYRATLDGVSVVRKEGPWVVALSGQCSPPWPENQFCLDRQALIGLWRAGAGLVLDGGNSKCQPELATFRRLVGDADCMPRSAKLLSAGEAEEAVELHYDSFVSTVTAAVLDPQTVEVRLGVVISDGSPVVASVVPAVRYGEEVTIGGVGGIALADGSFSYAPGEHAGWLAFRGIKLTLPPNASVKYPISPFNSYSADNTSPPSANRLLVACPLDGEPAVFRIVADET